MASETAKQSNTAGMKLHKLTSIILSDFMVGVSRGTEFIEEFDQSDEEKCTKYQDSIVTSIHALNEDTIAVNVDIG